jgi:hypothetical protein
MRRGWRAHRVARPAVWPTGQWGCCWPRPVRGGTPGSTGNALCPRSGRKSASAAPVRGGLSSARVPRSPCWRRPARRACPPPGGPVTASRARIGGRGCGWRRTPRPLSWRSRARRMSGGGGSNGRSKRSWRPGPPPPGHGTARAQGRKARGGRPGAGCPWPPPCCPRGGVGCWYGAVGVIPQT